MPTYLDVWIFRQHSKPKFNAEEVLPKILCHYEEFKNISEDIRIARDLKGKPWIQIGHKNHDFQFSLSHSGNYLVVALVRGQLVGIDTEKMRDDLKFSKLAEEYFSSEEFSIFQDLDRQGLDQKKRHYFYQIWTTKEAISKATGEGLLVDLRKLDSSLWEVRTIDIDPEHHYMTTLVLERGTPFEVRVFYG